MDNLFLEEFVENVDNIDPKDIKEIHIIDNKNTFELNNDNVLDHVDDFDINTETIIHKQENINENNDSKVYDISKLYNTEIKKDRLLISSEDMNSSYCYFNGSYECIFDLNKMYKNVIGFKLIKSIYETHKTYNGSKSETYLDVVINNIPGEACIDNLNGYNIIKRLPYEITYFTNASGISYDVTYDNDNLFYPINMDKLHMMLKYNYKQNSHSDFIDLLSMNNNNITGQVGLKYSFEFELTTLNK